jgi:hypothetical protein
MQRCVVFFEVNRRFRGAIVLMMEAVRISETSVYFNETMRCYMPEVSNLHNGRRESLKSHRDNFIELRLQKAKSKTLP